MNNYFDLKKFAQSYLDEIRDQNLPKDDPGPLDYRRYIWEKVIELQKYARIYLNNYRPSHMPGIPLDGISGNKIDKNSERMLLDILDDIDTYISKYKIDITQIAIKQYLGHAEHALGQIDSIREAERIISKWNGIVRNKLSNLVL